MPHTAGLLMSWLTGKRAHIFCFFSLTQGQVICLLLSAQFLSCTVWFINLLFIFFVGRGWGGFFSPCFFFSLSIFCPALTLPLSLPLLCRCFLLPRSHFCLILPTLPPRFFFHAPFLFCAMPQGPPGPQGSPHPQPPPPNSMMGPHSQVTIPLPFSLFFSVFAICSHLGTLVLSAGASCFGIRLSFRLLLVFTHMLSIKWNPTTFWEINITVEMTWSDLVSVVVLHVASFRRRPKRSPYSDEQPGRGHAHTHYWYRIHHARIKL